MSADGPVVRVSQVWESRDGTRQVHVGAIDGAGDDWFSFVIVQGRRSSRLRVQTLWDRYP